jgi:hypothetical protein
MNVITYMPLIVTVNTIAECLRTECNVLEDNKTKNSKPRQHQLLNYGRCSLVILP